MTVMIAVMTVMIAVEIAVEITVEIAVEIAVTAVMKCTCVSVLAAVAELQNGLQKRSLAVIMIDLSVEALSLQSPSIMVLVSKVPAPMHLPR